MAGKKPWSSPKELAIVEERSTGRLQAMQVSDRRFGTSAWRTVARGGWQDGYRLRPVCVIDPEGRVYAGFYPTGYFDGQIEDEFHFLEDNPDMPHFLVYEDWSVVEVPAVNAPKGGKVLVKPSLQDLIAGARRPSAPEGLEVARLWLYDLMTMLEKDHRLFGRLLRSDGNESGTILPMVFTAAWQDEVSRGWAVDVGWKPGRPRFSVRRLYRTGVDRDAHPHILFTSDDAAKVDRFLRKLWGRQA